MFRMLGKKVELYRYKVTHTKKLAVFPMLCFIICLVGFTNEKYIPPIDNQGSTSMCTAYAVADAIQAQSNLQGLEIAEINISELYSACCAIDKSAYGYTSIATALSIEKSQGYITDYRQITKSVINQALDNGQFVVISTNYGGNWFNGNSFISSAGSPMGKHATYLTGYDDTAGCYIGVNSWGTAWGDNGTFNLSYDYPILQAWTFDIGKTIRMTISKNTMTVNGLSIALDQPPVIDVNTCRTLVPLRAIAEALGCTVAWDNDTQTATITMK